MTEPIINTNGSASADAPGSANIAAPTSIEAESTNAQTADSFSGLNDPRLYLNRELTWLAFANRVLYAARDSRVPLLERVKFLAIVGSITDEFFMKRIGGLKQQLAANVHELTVDGRTPGEQIRECYEELRKINAQMHKTWVSLKALLVKEGIRPLNYRQVSPDDKAWLRNHYVENIFPLVTPQAMDPAHPFPFVSNLSLNLLVSLTHPRDTTPLLARVKVPTGPGISRFIRVRDTNVFVPLEDVMAENLDLLFPGMKIVACELFRATRNADVESDEEEADDLLALIESELRERRFAPIVRLEVGRDMVPLHQGRLAAELDLDAASDVFQVDGLMALRDLFEIASLDFPNLHDPDHRPVDNPFLLGRRNIFHAIRDRREILLHHPYESFATSVERFLREASTDPKVRAIKMTLYRTSSRSRVIDHLVSAAQNGKQVAVVVELKARFDEQANIRWASKLEEAGIHVTYGVVGLKTHCKVISVVRQDHDGLRRYNHIGTGNYHEETAKLYSDVGVLTCDPDIGRDCTELFNYLTTGYRPKRNYAKLLPAPKHLKSGLTERIHREIDFAKDGKFASIQIKTNALEDVDIVRSLYEASQAGVKVDLIVRDTCRLRPGLTGVSENIRVVSIVGRFLEHGRIYYFHNNGDSEYYIGSADCMHRNLVSRVEVITPVLGAESKAELREWLNMQFDDDRCAWDMLPDGTYRLRTNESGKLCSQQRMIEWAEKRNAEMHRLRRRKPRTIGRALPGFER
ncbi:MAG: polyphosphate kinase 1 [Polyangiales bacterium]